MNQEILYPSYRELLKADKIMARKFIIQTYQKTGNISEVARIFKTTRKTVRQIIKRYGAKGEAGLVDLSRRPKSSPKKTATHIEGIIIAEREKTGYGRERIARNLRERGIEVKESTIRYVLKRYKLTGKYKRSRYRKKVRFYDFESLHPLEMFQVDLKEIYDRTTLSKEAIKHAEELEIPLYQWTAIDVKTRIRFLSYSYTKSFTNGLLFMMSIIYFVRKFGMNHHITLQTDNGEEFGGKSPNKLEYLNREIFHPLNSSLFHIPVGKKEYNAFVERSHQTDDNEFYIPQIERCESKEEFFDRGLRWEWFYNTKRIHSTIGMTPYKKLCSHLKVPKESCLFPVMNLDNMTSLIQTYFKNFFTSPWILSINPGPSGALGNLILKVIREYYISNRTLYMKI